MKTEVSPSDETRTKRSDEESSTNAEAAVQIISSATHVLSGLVRELSLDDRESMDLLDEQIYSIGSDRASELLHARDEVLLYTHVMTRMLDGVSQDLGALVRNLMPAPS